MNQNTTPRCKHSAGSTQASRAAKSDQRDEMLGDDGKLLYTPEEWRQIKVMESLNERRRIDRLRAENDERIKSERKAAMMAASASNVQAASTDL